MANLPTLVFDFALLVGYAEDLTAIDVEQIEGVHAELNLTRAA